MQWMCGRGVALLLVPTLLQHTASSSASSDDADPATPAGLLTGTKQRGLRWAVNFPDAVEPFLLGSKSRLYIEGSDATNWYLLKRRTTCA